MASKIPPHVARELKRHVVKQQQKTTSASSHNSSNGSSSSKVLAGVLVLTGTMTVVPYLFINWIQPLTDRDGELTQSQIRRGAFNNSGSRDAGKDPYWDFKRGRRKKIGEDGCVDDGGYEDLFRRDQADMVEHGDELLSKSRRR